MKSWHLSSVFFFFFLSASHLLSLLSLFLFVFCLFGPHLSVTRLTRHLFFLITRVFMMWSACLCKLLVICVLHDWTEIICKVLNVFISANCTDLILFTLTTRSLRLSRCTLSLSVSCCTVCNYCGWNEAKSRTDCIKCVAFLWQNIFLYRPTWLSVSDMQFTKWAWADPLERFIIFPKVVSIVYTEGLMNRAYWDQAWGSWILSGQIKTA